MNYVMSDIHGHYNWFKQMLDIIEFNDNDHIYILGDVIDKGEDSASLLLEVLNDKRMTLLLGNHEKMLLNSFKSTNDETIWLVYNGGLETVQQFEQKGISLDIIKPKLEKLPVEIFLKINGIEYCLVHAKPIPKLQKDIIYQEDVEDVDIESMVWSRALSYDDSYANIFIDKYIGKDTIVVVGHTPVQYCEYNIKYSNKIAHICDNRIINIDCGCAGDYRLGCLRLEDMKEFYIPLYEHDEEIIVP